MFKQDRNGFTRMRLYVSMVAAILSLLILNSAVFAADTGFDRESVKQEVIDLIVSQHISGVEEKDLDTTDIDAIIASLGDPHTEFYDPDEWERFMDTLENQYSGIGVRVGIDDYGFFVHEVFPGTPAMNGGMLDGDYIVAVDGVSTEGLTLDELVSAITGEEGTLVRITVERTGERLELPLVRAEIQVPVLVSHLLDNGTGYVRLNGFSTNADEVFAAAVRQMEANGLSALVLDLRDNPGGLLESAGGVAGTFIKDGQLIYTRDRSGTEVPYPVSGDRPLDVPVYVLVNESSASASEVLAGALQDYGIATVIGTKTYGKGSVQNLYRLPGGAGLKLTVQEYLTPKKNRVDQVGITPDIEVFGDTAQLVTALQKAGDINIILELSKNELIVNGLKANTRFVVFRENGQVFVPSRVLAAVIDGEIAWQPDTRSAVIKQGETEAVFAADGEGTMMRGGTMFIDLALFERNFPAFDWQDGEDRLVLIESGEE